jgi:hypothetical protein
MATYISYTPSGIVGRAFFNFDAFGLENFIFSGIVNVSVSDAFTYVEYIQNNSIVSSNIYTTLATGRGQWTEGQLSNVDLVSYTYSNFIDLKFSLVTNYSGLNPFVVGFTSDINISFIFRHDLNFSGESAINSDTNFLYPGSSGDIVLNFDGFGYLGLNNDLSLDGSSFGFHVLMHEIGHSLGLSHPHYSIVDDAYSLTSDFAETVSVGFDKLGFQINSSADMNKEYFSIMSYDDDAPPFAADTFAQTPMILDVIALQNAYGEGNGTSGSGDDIITPGGNGGVSAFRTYFDLGGIDNISLANYVVGGYLNMGATILDANHLVGVSMSVVDANNLRIFGSDPVSLRWFYGEFENASGSDAADVIVGNSLSNGVNGQGGNDAISGFSGNDTIDGGAGVDSAIFQGNLSGYTLTKIGSNYTVRSNAGIDGTDTVTNVEALKFADKTVNLTIQAKAAATPQADVQSLSELYVAFFNRVPDADGLSYWIDQKVGGLSLNQIADSFYAVGIQYADLTGLSVGMTNTDFINVIYRNVLGRADGADADGLTYWNAELLGGRARGALVSTILEAAHTYKNDPLWRQVPDLLDNKIAVAKIFAIDWGLNYNTPQDSITQGMAIAAAITAAGTQDAIALIGVSGTEMHLV